MPNPTERILELEGELQSLRLELTAQRRTTDQLKLELERQRGGETARLATAQIEKLLQDVATPVSQLLTQTHLLKVEGRPVQANDVLAIVARLVRALEDHGLTIEGVIGHSVAFDPNRHEPLSMEEELEPGQAVIIRLVGLAYRGKLLRRAGVVAGE